MFPIKGTKKTDKKVVENNSDHKKKKNSKNIFLKEETTEENKETVDDSIFKKTEAININELKEKFSKTKKLKVIVSRENDKIVDIDY